MGKGSVPAARCQKTHIFDENLLQPTQHAASPRELLRTPCSGSSTPGRHQHPLLLQGALWTEGRCGRGHQARRKRGLEGELSPDLAAGHPGFI